MLEATLPIDVVPGTAPPVFRWRQTVDTLVGRHAVECEGALPPGVDVVVAELVRLAKQLEAANEKLQGRVAELEAGHTKQQVSVLPSSSQPKRSK